MVELEGSPENLQKAYDVLQLFCSASGAKVNWDKSCAVALQESTRLNRWGEDKGLRWLRPGEPAKYLGFQFGLEINREDRHMAILQQIRSKLTIWTPKRLSTPARVLVTNQVVLASIWYLASCSDISDAILLKTRTLVRNFIWGGMSDKCARAKVKWATAVIPTIKGGLKIFDPMAQAKALLAKLIPRALVPGKEPWKALIRYRIHSMQMRKDGDWGQSDGWLMLAPKIRPQGSLLWQAAWRAWVAVRPGTLRIPPQTHSEFMRQPLFLNPDIKRMDGFPIGTEKNSLFRSWSNNGVNRIGDIWDEGRKWYRDIQELHRMTRSMAVVSMRGEIATAIPWTISTLYHPQKGDWVYTTTPNAEGEQFFHLTDKQGSLWNGIPFIQTLDGSGRLLEGTTETTTPRGQLQEARVLARADSRAVLKINPQDISLYNNFSVFGDGKVRNLHFDPKEWVWRRQGRLEETNFFDYKTRRGYRIIIQSISIRLKFDKHLEDRGFSGQQRRQFFMRLWHPWLPRKVSTMIWLTIAEGIPVGDWRRRIGHTGLCNLCGEGQLQTPEHAFFGCVAIQPIWVKVRELFSGISGAPMISSWELALYGNLGHPRIDDMAEDVLWESGTHCTISARTLWDTFRMALIWFMWCQYVQYDLKNGDFHIGVIMFRAWQLTTQIGMAAWRQLQKFKRKRNPQKHAEMERILLNIWGQGGVFCTTDGRSPKWRLLPLPTFLPRELASRLRSTSVPVRIPGVPGYVSQPPESSDRVESMSSSSNEEESSRCDRNLSQSIIDRQAEQIADKILENILLQLDREVSNESSEEPRTEITHDLPEDILSPDMLEELNAQWTNTDS